MADGLITWFENLGREAGSKADFGGMENIQLDDVRSGSVSWAQVETFVRAIAQAGTLPESAQKLLRSRLESKAMLVMLNTLTVGGVSQAPGAGSSCSSTPVRRAPCAPPVTDAAAAAWSLPNTGAAHHDAQHACSRA